ncbi:hypothetical protein BDF20DRAFT_368977 [Mycotypha africana]|uniref:uncharacterized protein n=1 Tax=Mycotypha africana TaxID=64632 RepID=UPI002301AC13|nr:uncharacterized protein BDF20DRAFT_368977 [Mycotypha africana]KAI8984166.1 hypothetical protein BDF20DRAFT_368977 [Mycotypha africana]
MGYATLDAALGFPNNLPPNNSNILITDTLKSDANFLIHHFVINHLKNNKRVVLVGLSHIFNHYFLIGRKLVKSFYFLIFVRLGSLLKV